jgi:predicted ATPase with chaperone activity
MEPIGTIAPPPMPRPPESLEEAGLSEEFLAGLVIKALHHRGSAAGVDLSDMLALPFPLLDDRIEQLQQRRLVQVLATKGPTRGEYVFSLTSDGKTRAAEELELSRYVGPAPVPFEDFCRWIELQTIERTRISAQELQNALDGVVLPDAMFDLLGPAVNSGRSMFLYGESGNGKTLLAKRLARVFGERYYVPYSVLVDGSVMIVYDPVIHGLQPTDHGLKDRTGPGTGAVATDALDGVSADHGLPSADVLHEILRTVPEHDQRYAEARRPVVFTGGELTLEHLDLQWDAAGRMYQAPPQLKASGGVLVIDDLGRQRVQVPELLNRWGVPLEHRQDYLTLRSGRTIVVPFDCFVIFSTNLEPRSLADDAFLRRIHYKIEVADPSRAEYEEIFQSCCEERAIGFDEGALDYIFDEFYAIGAMPPRRCHPRDVLDHVLHLAEYRGETASLNRRLLEPACRAYFLPSD